MKGQNYNRDQSMRGSFQKNFPNTSPNLSSESSGERSIEISREIPNEISSEFIKETIENAIDTIKKDRRKKQKLQLQAENYGKGPKNYFRSDQRIWEDICEYLTWHPSIDASTIEVYVKNGRVSLKGKVDDKKTQILIEDVVEDVAGVQGIDNEIIIQIL